MTHERRSLSAKYTQRIARLVIDDGLSVRGRDEDLGEAAVRRLRRTATRT